MADKKKQDNRSAMDQLLGPLLLTSVDTTKPTDQVLKDKPLVAVYFSASWCKPCRGFTPVLAEFYKLHSKDIEIVYLSSDHSVEEFNGYFGNMPWVAQPIDTTSALLKQELSNKCKVRGIPALIVLETKTGKFITDMARNQVMSAVESKTTAKLVEEWKQTKAVPFEEAIITGGRDQGLPTNFVGFLGMMLRNPMTIVVVVFIVKKVLKYLAAYTGKKGGHGEL
jgi:nucleoredoxin